VQVAVPEGEPPGPEVLSNLGLDPEQVTAIVDEKNRIWVSDAGLALEGDFDSFVSAFASMDFFVYDSPSFNAVRRENYAPIKRLRELHEATEGRQVSLCGIIETEMIARVCRKVFFEELRGSDPTEWKQRTFAFFGKVLGPPEESDTFWTKNIIPQVLESFGISVVRDSEFRTPPELFAAIQYLTGCDISKQWPFAPKDVRSIRPVVCQYVLELCDAIAGPPPNLWQLLLDGHLIEAIILLNQRSSLLISLKTYPILVSLNLGFLSQAYKDLGLIERAIVTADRALRTERKWVKSHIPAYCAQLSLNYQEINATLDFASGIAFPSPLLTAEVLIAAASAHRAHGNLSAALPLVESAYRAYYDIDHPRARACLLLQGLILSGLSRPGDALPPVEQVLAAALPPLAMARAKFTAAQVRLESGRLTGVLDHGRDALAIRQDNFDVLDQLVAASELQVASILQAVQQIRNADQEFIKTKEPAESAEHVLKAAKARADDASLLRDRLRDHFARSRGLQKAREQFEAAAQESEKADAEKEAAKAAFEKVSERFQRATEWLDKEKAQVAEATARYGVVWEYLRISEDDGIVPRAIAVLQGAVRLCFDVSKRRFVDQMRAAKGDPKHVRKVLIDIVRTDVITHVTGLIKEYEDHAKRETFTTLVALYQIGFAEGPWLDGAEILALFKANGERFQPFTGPTSPSRTPGKSSPSSVGRVTPPRRTGGSPATSPSPTKTSAIDSTPPPSPTAVTAGGPTDGTGGDRAPPPPLEAVGDGQAPPAVEVADVEKPASEPVDEAGGDATVAAPPPPEEVGDNQTPPAAVEVAEVETPASEPVDEAGGDATAAAPPPPENVGHGAEEEEEKVENPQPD
jgi:tetratricopeptide (TPR) repeat protein